MDREKLQEQSDIIENVIREMGGEAMRNGIFLDLPGKAMLALLKMKKELGLTTKQFTFVDVEEYPID